MKIGIIGAGSIGLLFAFYLSEHHDVTLYCKRKEQANTIDTEGVKLKMGETVLQRKIRAMCSTKWLVREQLVIVAVKQYAIQSIIHELHKLPSEIPLLFLQNGMGHLDELKTLPQTSILLGTVEHGALRVSDDQVNHTGYGITKLAVYRGIPELAETFVRKLRTKSFPFDPADHFETMMKDKLIVNAVINPLTALLRVRNGQLIANPYYFHLMKIVFAEVADVFELENREREFHRIVSICERTAENYSSMCKDVFEGRKTEIDGIVGYLLQEADRKSISVSVLPFLYNAVKGTE
ncbi:2-dehydropantoate 2-reductase [Fervidibacillus albus]|uniref:2-dehydropantoate 2-reductase n=1 Tax=Fervidibacillus albus TaxID=2980026 RepID=A0A9E8RYH0_9BACI|nr:2-dehydropantoate 2-reductase [Fervidibacillus albus]WAA10622.1 2-dehydropantoate 2-reductase [Fervidibacillus albus]